MDRELALLSEAVYLPEWEDVEKAIAPYWQLVHPLDIANTEAMICRRGAEATALVFRGTEASRGNLWDIFQNIGTMAEWEGPGSVHSGYLKYVNRIYPYASKLLASLAGAPLFVTGHSMGGAAATLFAAKNSIGSPVKVDALVTFGAPKCMNREAASILEALPTRRYVNEFDLAVYWPLNPWFVHHCEPTPHPGRGHSVTTYKESFK